MRFKMFKVVTTSHCILHPLALGQPNSLDVVHNVAKLGAVLWCVSPWVAQSADAATGSSLSSEEAQQGCRAAMALPTVLPPGGEAAALQALSSAFQTALLGPILTAACRALQRLQASRSSLALAAAGWTFEQMRSRLLRHPGSEVTQSMETRHAWEGQEQSAHSGPVPADGAQSMHSKQAAEASPSAASTVEGAEPQGMSAAPQGHKHTQIHSCGHLNQSESVGQMQQEQQQEAADMLYPLEPFPEQAVCCQRLLQGYCAPWLGLVPAAPIQSTHGSRSAADEVPHALLQPIGECLIVIASSMV